jgi:hypothetical protein
MRREELYDVKNKIKKLLLFLRYVGGREVVRRLGCSTRMDYVERKTRRPCWRNGGKQLVRLRFFGYIPNME